MRDVILTLGWPRLLPGRRPSDRRAADAQRSGAGAAHGAGRGSCLVDMTQGLKGRAPEETSSVPGWCLIFSWFWTCFWIFIKTSSKRKRKLKQITAKIHKKNKSMRVQEWLEHFLCLIQIQVSQANSSGFCLKQGWALQSLRTLTASCSVIFGVWFGGVSILSQEVLYDPEGLDDINRLLADFTPQRLN